MKTIKAIETRYKGYRFRSRLEARWAVFFDELGFDWEYEKEGFDLGSGIKYLPDFYIKNCNAWIEIKGGEANDSEIEKCIALINGLNSKIESIDLIALADPKITWDIMGKCIIDFLPKDATMKKKMSLLNELVSRARKKTKVYLFEGLMETGWFFTNEGAVQINVANALWFLGGIKKKREIHNAFLKARSARFEHGEKP